MKIIKTEVEDGSAIAQKLGTWNELCTTMNLSRGVIERFVTWGDIEGLTCL